ncbi:hypothetical protein Taro_039943 [Colocasia esculenta]|uniref:Uncharacterized protein n=1 Tax=Colocasia esculenta TaxID=4460 RepID=A0A843WH84_COLES|nr:hypothetical protein [Colocasia esculenta]
MRTNVHTRKQGLPPRPRLPPGPRQGLPPRPRLSSQRQGLPLRPRPSSQRQGLPPRPRPSSQRQGLSPHPCPSSQRQVNFYIVVYLKFIISNVYEILPPGRPSEQCHLRLLPHHKVESQHPAAEEGPQLPGPQPCWISGGKIDPSPASRYITTLVYAHIPGPVDAWRDFPVPVRDLLFDMFTRRFAFTRPEDLPRARAVWEITTQTNLRKSMWEVRDKAMKTTGNRDPMAWVDYGPVWMRRDYWESLCERWAARPWQQRSQAAIRNRATQPEKNVHTSGSISYATHSKKLHHDLERAPTFRELFDRTHKRKGTDDYDPAPDDDEAGTADDPADLC